MKQSDKEAYLWGRKAANKGLAKAEYAVGCKLSLYMQSLLGSSSGVDYTEIGIGVSQDIGTAKRWYMRAAGVSFSLLICKQLLISHIAQQHKRAMQRLTELSTQKAPKGKGARPTRHDAQSECNIM